MQRSNQEALENGIAKNVDPQVKKLAIKSARILTKTPKYKKINLNPDAMFNENRVVHITIEA